MIQIPQFQTQKGSVSSSHIGAHSMAATEIYCQETVGKSFSDNLNTILK